MIIYSTQLFLGTQLYQNIPINRWGLYVDKIMIYVDKMMWYVGISCTYFSISKRREQINDLLLYRNILESSYCANIGLSCQITMSDSVNNYTSSQLGSVLSNNSTAFSVYIPGSFVSLNSKAHIDGCVRWRCSKVIFLTYFPSRRFTIWDCYVKMLCKCLCDLGEGHDKIIHVFGVGRGHDIMLYTIGGREVSAKYDTALRTTPPTNPSSSYNKWPVPYIKWNGNRSIGCITSKTYLMANCQVTHSPTILLLRRCVHLELIPCKKIMSRLTKQETVISCDGFHFPQDMLFKSFQFPVIISSVANGIWWSRRYRPTCCREGDPWELPDCEAEQSIQTLLGCRLAEDVLNVMCFE